MSSTEPREHRQICTRSIETRNTWSTGSTEPRDTESTRSASSSQCIFPKYSSCPRRNNFAPTPTHGIMGPSVSVFVRTMGLRIVDTVHLRSKYTSYTPKDTAHVESISVLRVLAVRTLPTDKILTSIVLAVPTAVQNPEILRAQ